MSGMAAKRFLPDVDRTRRAAGWILIALFAYPLAWIFRIVAAGHPNGTAIVFFLLIAGMAALGARLAFWPREFLEIDVFGRTFSVIRKGERSAAGALDSLGPLEVRKRTRIVATGKGRRTVTEYVVRGAVHSGIDLYVMKTSGKARQRMEALALAWHLPCQSLGGAVRSPDALDMPLHERLRGDGAARKPVPLSPEWGVRIEPLSPGYAVVSTHRSYEPLQTVGAIGIATLFLLAGPLSDLPFLKEFLGSARNGDPMALVISVLIGLAALFVLWLVGTSVRDAFFPGTVHITDQGLSYRGRRMRFAEIEEVTATSPIEIVGDRRILSLAGTFCPLAASDALVHELQRLIVEVAATSPDQA